jgi:hypothetical protein
MLRDRPFTRAFTGDVKPQPPSEYRDQWPIVPAVSGSDDTDMKRIAAGLLWFLVGWYVGSAASWALGAGPLLAPIAALALTGLVLLDPRAFLWGHRQGSQPRG